MSPSRLGAGGVDGAGWPRRGVAGARVRRPLARHSPARLALGVFGLVITIFTLLLSTPWATAERAAGAVRRRAVHRDLGEHGHRPRRRADRLVLVDAGLVVILVAIKVGGLGVMTLASLLGMAVSRRIGLTQRLLVSSETKETRLGEVGSLIRTVIITSMTLEALIAIVLFPRFLMYDEGLGRGRLALGLLRDLGVQQRRLRARPRTAWTRSCPTGGS